MRLLRALAALVPAAFCLITALPSIAQQPPSADARVQATIKSWQAAGGVGDVYIYAKNLDTGADYAFHADDPVPSASTIKLPAMAEEFTLAAQGKLDWNKKITLTDADKVTGSGFLQNLAAGDQFTLHDLTEFMIDFSDNTGTNMVLDQLDGNQINALMTSLGLKHTAIMRHIGQPRVFPNAEPMLIPGAPPIGQTTEGAKPENKIYGTGRTCPRDMVILLDKLDHGTLVSKAASDEMIKIMKLQFYHYAARDLAKYDVASKSGGLDHLRSDVALIYTPHGTIAMAITVNNIQPVNWGDNNQGVILISNLSEVLIDALATPGPSAAAQ
jgi:beta-lactamase class A